MKSSVTSMLQSLNWRSLENKRKDVPLHDEQILKGLVAIRKEERLIPPKRSMKHALPPDIPELETLEAFKASVAIRPAAIDVF